MTNLENIYIYSFSTNQEIRFPAFVTDFSDTFTSNWTPQDIYGRMDPIYTYKNTVRKITLAFDVPSKDFEAAAENNSNMDILIKSLYPIYDVGEGKGTATLQSPPLFRIKLANLIQGSAFSGQTAVDGGLLGIIDAFSFKPDMESGFIKLNDLGSLRKNNLYSKLFKVNFNFMVIHEHPLGNYVKENNHKNRLQQSGYNIEKNTDQINFPFPHNYDISKTDQERQTTQQQITTKVGQALNKDIIGT